jgi:Cytosine/adenosine deaminases
MSDQEAFIRKCYELAISAGKRGYHTFGAILVHNGQIIEQAENRADDERGIFGHAEFNLVHKLANQYSDQFLRESVLYTSTAPCRQCVLSIASLGIEKVVYGVSYAAFHRLFPFEPEVLDYEAGLAKLGTKFQLIGPVLEEEGMQIYQYWKGGFRPLDEMLAEAARLRAQRQQQNQAE